MTKLQRSRTELANFLRAKRESINPESVGLPNIGRRRTPGLRREEIAALAGVGLTWYTWLEQGRDIGVSATFLDNLAKVLMLNMAERRHLYLLAHMREPAETGETQHVVSPLIQRIMEDLSPHLTYVLNLHWDVLAYNQPADEYFRFSQFESTQQNFLLLLFTSEYYRHLFYDWEKYAYRMLASFRRDYALTTQNTYMQDLVNNLLKISPDFYEMWHRHEIYEPCNGVRELNIHGRTISFDYTSMVIDVERHLRLIVHAEN
ncbi:transcriptional regulator [Xenorhabdus mauleonii]|uniref:Helix-turn-helix domain-containing protein n=1 Tax=Xenorhabdus mauleonii TaxID=351675 RepID=A0A1I3M1F0_9GAMM|nr:helix-turn-helix transcriptional regulator [Xenorhabdus mauleonii]PHM45369.1 transcriptional regulator [Xenorhabdus mauleonii]SFI90747.1 Helix-turn-helix domain-containing protein [Xenorhabdus mauleonii]